MLLFRIKKTVYYSNIFTQSILSGVPTSEVCAYTMLDNEYNYKIRLIDVKMPSFVAIGEMVEKIKDRDTPR